jgi:hypothetical protein
VTPQHLLRATERQSKTGHDLVKDQQRTVGLREPPCSFEKFTRRHNQPHVSHHWLHHDCRNRIALGAKGGFELAGIVVFQHDGVLDRASRHAR